MPHRSRARGVSSANRGVRAGWVTRVGIRVGIPGGYTGVLPTDRARKSQVQRSGPVRPCRGLEWWYLGLGA